MDICHLKSAELETKHQKYIGRVVLRGDIVKDDSGSYAVFTEQGSSASQNDSSKSHGYHLQTAWLRRTSSRCTSCLYPGKNGRCSKIFENSQIGMSRHLDSSTTTQMAKIMIEGTCTDAVEIDLLNRARIMKCCPSRTAPTSHGQEFAQHRRTQSTLPKLVPRFFRRPRT